MKKQLSALLLLTTLAGTTLAPLPAEAKHCRWNHHGRHHDNNGRHKGWNQNFRNNHDEHLVSWKTSKILRGGLVGAGVGAGAGLLLNKPVGRTALVGAGVGSGVQAVRYSRYMNRHPIVKTAAYGALAGAGASQLTREGSLGKGALLGAAIGTGVGALKTPNRYRDFDD